MCSSSGCTRRNVSSGPEATRLNFPARTTLPLPLTGAARKATPRFAQAARISSDAVWSTVGQSTTIAGTSSPSASRPPSPSSTCRRSADVETMTKTTSRPRSSAIESATTQPRSASGWALALVRFQTVTFSPARARRAAIAAPIRPAPIQPTDSTGVSAGFSFIGCSLCIEDVVSGGLCQSGREPGGQPVGRVGPVPRRQVGASVVALLEHQQLGLAAGGVAQPLGVLPRNQPVLAAEHDEQRG